ncbi:MAG: MarR family transcriptional regulator [bacterium]|nr:MarR family transcriptional regulator [bacterium]
MEEFANELKNHFTDSLFYEIELTAKYCKKMAIQVLENCNSDLAIEEFAVLDTVMTNPEICQRDIAKLILKDRANTGKILDGLEEKGYIERILTTRNNRAVKIVKLTQNGLEKTETTAKNIYPHIRLVEKKIKNHDLEKVSVMLKELRNVLNETIEIQI